MYCKTWILRVSSVKWGLENHSPRLLMGKIPEARRGSEIFGPLFFQEVCIRHWGIKSWALNTFRRAAIKITAGCRRQPELFSTLAGDFSPKNSNFIGNIMPIDRPTEVKGAVMLWWTFLIRQYNAAKKCFKSFLETETSIKFRNLKRGRGSIFVYSIQLSWYLLKRETSKFVYSLSHYRVYVCARTYYL